MMGMGQPAVSMGQPQVSMGGMGMGGAMQPQGGAMFAQQGQPQMAMYGGQPHMQQMQFNQVG